MRSYLSWLAKRRAWAATSKVVVAGRWERRASLVSSRARQDWRAILPGEGAGRLGGVVSEFVDEAGGAGFGRREAGAGVEHAAGDLLASGLGEAPVAAGTRDDAKGGLGLAEERLVRRDAQVAGEGEFAAAAEGGAVDRGDRGPAVRLELLEQPGVDGEEGRVSVAVAEFSDVGAGGEDAGGGGVDDEHAGLLARVVECGREGVGRGLVDRVALIRAVQADPPDSALVAYFDRAHRRPFVGDYHVNFV